MAIKTGTQSARILHALRDGRWHSAADIRRRVGMTSLSARISELRHEHGYIIEHRLVKGKPRALLAHQYRLTGPDGLSLPDPGELPERTVLDRDAIPRDSANRYRLYRLIRNQLELVATCRTPQAIGVSLVELGKKGEFAESCVGLLDTFGTDSITGSWILNPWDTEPLS
jgi:Helix-turn-helix domain